jgi:hypothetical protein
MFRCDDKGARCGCKILAGIRQFWRLKKKSCGRIIAVILKVELEVLSLDLVFPQTSGPNLAWVSKPVNLTPDRCAVPQARLALILCFLLAASTAFGQYGATLLANIPHRPAAAGELCNTAWRIVQSSGL